MRVSTVGRSTELAAVSRFVTSAAMQPSGLVIEGDAGIGKTTVWLAGVEQAMAEGFRVLSARVGQAESVLAYATVADLISDVEPALLETLPDVQRIALERILLRTDEHGPDTGPWVPAAAFLSVLQALTERSPVLVAIDDVQWLDSSSRAAVEFAIRRLGGRFGIMVTGRTDAEHPVSAPWLEVSTPDSVTRMRVGPMSLGALHELISAWLDRSLPRPTMVRIAEVSGGNPFYALELARAVVSGAGGRDAALPATLADLVRGRTQRYSDDTQEVLLAAACVSAPTVDLVAAATGLANARVVDLLEQPELDGLLSIDGNRLRFSHPLLAQSVYTHAAAAQRRRMHKALANVEPEPELKARHLALSSTSADDEVLQSLDAAAEVARGRGAPAAAAELVDLARHLGGDDVMRRLRAAADHFQAGDTAAAQPLLEATLAEVESGFVRAIALMMLGGIRIYENVFAEAERLLVEAVDHAEAVPGLKVKVLMPLAFAQGLAHFRHDAQLATARAAVDLAEEHCPPADLSQALTQFVNMSYMAGNPLDEENLRRAIELEDLTTDLTVQFSATVVAGLMAAYRGQFDDAETKLSAMRQHFLERGAERDLMAIAGYRAIVAMWRGRLDDAAEFAEEALERSEQLGGNTINVIPLSVRAQIRAYTGRQDEARRDAATVLEAAQRLGVPSMSAWPIMTMAFLDVSNGDYLSALTTWEPLFADLADRSNSDPMNAFGLPDAIEAMVAVGRLDEAEQWLGPWEEKGERSDRAWLLAVSARCRGMLFSVRGDLDSAIDAAQRSLREFERMPMPFERARTLLLLGQLYRRKRQRQKAADALTEAQKTFQELGATVWARRAEAELPRTGGGRRMDVELTQSEQRVADLAATGMTNRDIAAALFISPKTVEHHIGRVYRKLGIRTRAELGRRMSEQ